MARHFSIKSIEDTLRKHRSKEVALAIVDHVGDDPVRMRELMKCLFSEDKRLAELAAWPSGIHFEEYPAMMKPYYARLIKVLKEEHHHGAVHRCILRGFISAPLPERYRDSILNICLLFIKDPSREIAIRAFSIKIVTHLCRQYNELKEEFLLLLRELKEYDLPPALNATIRYAQRILKFKV